ncbi:hypothetical protein [Quadrisphaera sp. INWT6]|uniref:hypothetical protein n=1 Tax=Quadrisphaera sp. INWT6 TaxID=2596917 RepID=UPI00189249DE|nr:hypothetical protein [Quadrisphaera sp. INWT6]MBF5082510.1 hypothetical protein [Quadrisphaera sp. INWT6]
MSDPSAPPPQYTPPPGYEEYAPRSQTPQAPQTPYGPAHQPPGPYAGQPQRPTSVTAVVGFVLAFLVSPVGAVVSAFGIGDTRGGRKGGRGLAVAGVVGGVLGTLAWVAVVLAAVAFYRSVSPQVSDTLRQIEQLPAPSDLPSGFPTDLPSGLPSSLPSDLPTDLPGSTGAAADVQVTSCTSGLGGLATADLVVTNSGDSPSTYLVTLSALDASGQEVGQLVGGTETVAPGATAQAQAVGFASSDGDGSGLASCRVDSALRTEG